MIIHNRHIPVAVFIICILLAGLLIRHHGTNHVLDLSVAETGTQAPSSAHSPQNPVDFIREHVAMEVHEDSVTVTGTYWFRVNDRRGDHLPILYPFPVDNVHEHPTFIHVVDADGVPIEFDNNPDAESIHFLMDLSPAPEFTVTYTQHVTRTEARYILTTTSAWEKPLEHAAFSVTLPEEYEFRSLSYAYDDVRVADGRQIYTFQREQFMPDHDLSVSWTVKGGDEI